MSLLSLTNPPGWSVCSALCILIVLLREVKADNLNTTTQRNGGGSQCGEYTNQVVTVNIPNRPKWWSLNKLLQERLITAFYILLLLQKCVSFVKEHLNSAGIKIIFHFLLYLQWKSMYSDPVQGKVPIQQSKIFFINTATTWVKVLLKYTQNNKSKSTCCGLCDWYIIIYHNSRYLILLCISV